MGYRFRILVMILSCFSLFSLGFGRPVQGTDGWEPVSTGIEYQEFSYTTADGPVHAYVARMDRSNPQVILESSLGQGNLLGGWETVSRMAKRYDQAITYWDVPEDPASPVVGAWGSRSRVVVAINGSYNDGGMPDNGMVQSGWYIKRYNDLGGGTGFAWTMNRAAFIGGCAYHSPERQVIQFANGNQMSYQGINAPRGGDQAILYTPQYDSNTWTDDSGVEILVEMSRPLMILPNSRPAAGVIRDVRDGAGSTFIPFDHLVLSASGDARDVLLENIQEGEQIFFSQEITHFESNCATPNLNNWTKTYAGVGGNWVYLKMIDGQVEVQTFEDDKGATSRHPRTSIAFNDQYVYYIVVDGRQPAHSIGMTIDELAYFSKDVLGAQWAVNQDGGGSSTMVVNGVVKNIPSDPCYRGFLPFISDSGSPPPVEPLGKEKTRIQEYAPPFACERNVPNGMMMVVVEEMNKTETFSVGQAVSLREDGRMRLGPGTNYTTFSVLPTGSLGVVVEHSLQGVFAKGYNWWKVAIGDSVGWLPEPSLQVPTPIPPTGTSSLRPSQDLKATMRARYAIPVRE